ncbi:MAG: nucleoside deaminase [Deltaproteobacteria bacterium]
MGITACPVDPADRRNFLRKALEADILFIALHGKGGEDGLVAARGHNLRETLNDPTSHAEIMALRWAAMDRGTWRFTGVTAYVTLEPCAMCAGALVNARVTRVVYGADDPKAGAVRSLFTIGQDPRLNHRFELTTGVLADECGDVLRRFFARIRARGVAKRAGDKPRGGAGP